jgi:hypothetical protein
LTTFWIVGPDFRQVQAEAERRTAAAIRAVQAHGDLAIRLFAQRSAVLTLYADRVLTLFRETGIIQDPNFRRGKRRLDALGHRLPNRLPRPRALAEKLLQVLFIRIGQARRDRSGALALPIEQQAAHVEAAPVSSLTPPQGSQHLFSIHRQPLPAPLDLLHCHANSLARLWQTRKYLTE